MTDETENEPWTPDQTEIEQIIRDHELWLLEDIRTGDDSRRANFRSANLNGRGIKSANLSEADLSAANLTNCEFQKTILHNANFLKSNLAESHFWDTSISRRLSLRHRSLRRAFLGYRFRKRHATRGKNRRDRHSSVEFSKRRFTGTEFRP
ncbi:MAG TPA: hypothetical protein DCE33_02925 [Rhodospirillaceae bacterium]|nr:hypothetical protein [Rhodospirillaceae bacterium]